MLILSIIAAMVASSAMPYPAGFAAHCKEGKVTSVWFDPRDPSHPRIRPPTLASYAIAIARQNGQYSVELLGPDYDILQIDSSEFHLKVLKATPGDLVLSVQTSTRGTSLTTYHLRYAGNTGALSIAKTSYYGHGDDETSLTVMTCKIGAQSWK